jgi:hypothetical protein
MEFNNNNKTKPNKSKTVKLKPIQNDSNSKISGLETVNESEIVIHPKEDDMFNFIGKKNNDIIVDNEVVKPKQQPKHLEPIETNTHNTNKKQEPLQLNNLDKRFDLTESYYNNLYFLNEDNEIDKTETWWNNIQNEASILTKEMTNLNTNID